MFKITVTRGYNLKRKFTYESGGLVDHSITINIELEAIDLNQKSKTIDFHTLSLAVNENVSFIDGCCILKADDEIAQQVIDSGMPCLIIEDEPTDEILAQLIFDYMDGEFGPFGSIHSVSVSNMSNITSAYKGGRKRIIQQRSES